MRVSVEDFGEQLRGAGAAEAESLFGPGDFLMADAEALVAEAARVWAKAQVVFDEPRWRRARG